MRTASAMICAAGEMPRAAQAAPIPDPTATPMDQAACIIGMRVRPAARSTAAPSTLISTSRVPMPSPTITKATASSGTEPAMSARPMTVIAAAMSSSAPVTARRLPSQCRTGVDASSPRMAPTVTPARSSPIVAVPMPRLALMAGSRGPHAEMVIPPSPNAAVIVHRQRASAAARRDKDVRHRAAPDQRRAASDAKTFQWKVSRAENPGSPGAAAPGSTASGRRPRRRDRAATGSAGRRTRRSPARPRPAGRCPPRCDPACCPDSIRAASVSRSDRNRSRTNSRVTACCSCSASVVSVA